MLLNSNKKGVSVLIGYVLLVVFAVVIGAIVFAWLRSYVPGEALNCPDGTSVFIQESSYNDSTLQLKIVLKNNGRFDIAGFFIHAANSSEQEVATIDLSNYSSNRDLIFGNSVVYDPGENSMSPGDTNETIFDLSYLPTIPYSVSIIPVRYQIEGNRERFVSCGNAKVESLAGEPVSLAGCEPAADPTLSGICGTRICGTATNGTCGSVLCRTCTPPEECDLAGQCYNPITCVPAADPTFSGICGSQECGYALNGTAPDDCGNVLCGTCDDGYKCNATNQCELLCGNGEIDSGEICDGGVNCQVDCTCPSGYIADGNLGCTTIGNGVCDPGETCATAPDDCEGEQASCLVGQICQLGSCEWQGGAYGEDEYCIDIPNTDYTSGDCANNVGQCTNPGSGAPGVNEDDEPGAETYCPGSPLLCCKPVPVP